MRVGVEGHAMVYKGIGSEDDVVAIHSLLHHVDSRDATQVSRLGNKCHYLQRPLSGPFVCLPMHGDLMSGCSA